MNPPCYTLQLMILVLLSASVRAQGTFRNLGFEEAAVSPSPPEGQIVAVSNGLPGWAAFVGTEKINSMYHNWVSLGGAVPSILGPGFFTPESIIEGFYTALLRSGTLPGTDLSLAQTEVIPASAKSLRYKIKNSFGTRSVSLSGIPILEIPLEVDRDYTVFGADIHNSLVLCRNLGSLLYPNPILVDL